MKTVFLAAALLVSPVAFAQSKKPVDVSVGWAYDYADQGSGFTNLNGWYATVNWELWKQVALSVNHQSYWGGFAGSGVNQHVWLGGASVKLRKGNPAVQPFVSPMAGVTRSSASGSIQQQPTFQLGAGADITLKGSLAFELIPAEYNYSHGSSGTLNSYQAAVGLQYSFGK